MMTVDNLVYFNIMIEAFGLSEMRLMVLLYTTLKYFLKEFLVFSTAKSILIILIISGK